MPKARYRASKAVRNDPLARPSPAQTASKTSTGDARRANSGARKSSGPGSTTDDNTPTYAISLLKKLPLPSTPRASLLPISETVWTLSALSSQVSHKQVRTALLHPENKFGQRLLHALDPSTYSHLSGEEDVEDRLACLTQASGVLRNLCIDAPWGVRDNLGKQGLVARCIAVLQLVLYQQEQVGASDAEQAHAEGAVDVLDKPLDQMNRKERRHAAKAAMAASAAASATSNGDSNVTTMTTSSAPASESTTAMTPAALAASSHTLALLDNVLTLIWCLSESSSESLLNLVDGAHLNTGVLDEDRAQAYLVSTVLSDALLSTVQAGLEQCTPNGVSVSISSRKAKSAVLLLQRTAANSKLNPGAGLRQLARTAANTLCALTDMCPGFVRTLVGVHIDALPSDALGDAQLGTARDPSTIARSLSAQRFEDTLGASVRALAQTLERTSAPSVQLTPQEHTARELGVLGAAIIRNVVHCASTSDEIVSKRKSRRDGGANGSGSKKGAAKNAFVKRVDDTAEVQAAKDVLIKMLKEEQDLVVDVLLRYVELEASQAGVGVDSNPTSLVGWVSLAQAAHDPSNTSTDSVANGASLDTRRAQDRIQTLQLALETLAELASAASTVAVAEQVAEAKRHAAADDGRLDHEGDQSMADDGEDTLEMELLDDGSGDEGGDDEMETDAADGHGHSRPPQQNGKGPHLMRVPFVFALLSEHRLPTRLLAIVQAVLASHATTVFPSSNATTQLTDASESLSATLRALVSRSLSAAANALLSMASEAPPTPSEPEYLEPIKWARAGDSLLQTKASKERFLAWADPTLVPGASSTRVAGYAVLVELWTEAWQLAVGLAEVPAIVGKSLVASESNGTSSKAPESSDEATEQVKDGDEGWDGRQSLEACLSMVWAVARAFEPVLDLPRPAQPALFVAGDASPFRAEPGSSVVPALQAAYISAQSDSMRVRCLGVLGCVGRLGRYSSVENGHVDSEELVERNRVIGETLVTVLEALPIEGSSSSRRTNKTSQMQTDSTSASSSDLQLTETSAECMVAALNAIMDLYADERAVWDKVVFRQGNFLPRLRKLVSQIRASIRTIDKRKDPGLRARADETVQNYRAFVEFRATIK